MNVITALLAALALAIAALGLWRWSDTRADAAERTRLLTFQPETPALFDPAMAAELPEPARRYFTYMIAPGTPLYTVVEVDMHGQFGMGTKDAPNYVPMTATQTLATPHGFIWQMRARGGGMWLSGSDSGAWTRFWLYDLAPVARAGGGADHRMSAFGRYAIEAVFWSPAALLPGPGIAWEALDNNRAQVTITHDDLEEVITLTVDANGQPTSVSFMRWSNENAEKTFRRQPFGGTLSDFQTFGGYTLPTHVEAGNHFGTDAYYPFFIADVSAVRFP
ncbi:DUF6544 family protein [Cognatiyoonia sp. IB215182]|uniref:DUF6544 family protein n=1 Tax=Cognatiyoonia sp. IB215182 TaxID=3097353 RepID=UPI002A16A4F6|nr:DUF6544 family protein [Cognatiyoonia sp. IB215182]MDX8354992.1 DUF6544 family protein [Cognatiyoonia sp. IB215182]